MIWLALLFLCLGALASMRSRAALRAYNRRMFPSMQQRAPVHLRPFLWCTLLALAALAVAVFIPFNP